MPDLSKCVITVAAANALLTGALTEGESFAAVLTAVQKNTLTQSITANGIKKDIERYTGVRPVFGGTKVVSRHIHHPANLSAVTG